MARKFGGLGHGLDALMGGGESTAFGDLPAAPGAADDDAAASGDTASPADDGGSQSAIVTGDAVTSAENAGADDNTQGAADADTGGAESVSPSVAVGSSGAALTAGNAGDAESDDVAASAENAGTGNSAQDAVDAGTGGADSVSTTAAGSDDVAHPTENAAADDSTLDAAPAVGTQPQLPAGITVDESGQLWAETARLQPNPHQPRHEFDEEKLLELADSIRQHGVIEAVIVEDAGDGTFYIIAGERRTRAARMAGLERVPVQLRRYSEQKKLEVALIENIQRADLNAIEEAQAYYKLMELGALTQEQVASRVGKNRATVANAIRLLKLPEDMQAAIVQGKLSAGHARALLSVSDSADQRVLFGKILGSGMSVRQAETAAAELNGAASSTGSAKPQKDAPAADTRDPDFAALEGQFRDALGTKVALKGSLKRGTLVIDYFSRADLDRLYGIFTRG